MLLNMREYYSGKTVLITGVCGTVGSELVRQLLRVGDVQIRGIDNNESALFLASEEYSSRPEVDLLLGDLRDRDCLRERFRGVDIVFHTAALKHVHLSERSPHDAIQSNIIGTQNVIEAAIACGVEKVNLTSSDKAVNPTNVMGTSKLMGERLMTAAATRGGPIFLSTRFGNVLGSRGSVIPIFREQIANRGPVHLTDKSMTRFIMSLEQSVHLVMEATRRARGGEVFVTKMPVIAIADLATVMIEELAPVYGHRPSDIEIREIGPRPGEKMYEELLTEEEGRRAFECGEFIVIMPAACMHRSRKNGRGVEVGAEKPTRPYHSGLERQLTLGELRKFLLDNCLLEQATGEKRCA